MLQLLRGGGVRLAVFQHEHVHGGRTDLGAVEEPAVGVVLQGAAEVLDPLGAAADQAQPRDCAAGPVRLGKLLQELLVGLALRGRPPGQLLGRLVVGLDFLGHLRAVTFLIQRLALAGRGLQRIDKLPRCADGGGLRRRASAGFGGPAARNE